MRLRPIVEQDDAKIDDLDLSYIGDDPLNYFLTPTPSSQDDDAEDAEIFDFDAGIENTKKPAPIVRSVSPSNLNSGFRLPLRPPSPPKIFGSPSSVPDLDMSVTPDEVDETYLPYGSSSVSPFSPPLTLKDFAGARIDSQREKPVRSASATLLSPSPSYSTSPRGRVSQRPGPRPLGAAGAHGRARTWSGRLSPHAWRVPSPDVWSIEEETEEELHYDYVGSYLSYANRNETHTGGAKPIDIKAAKPKKKVRFVLPAQDIMG